MFTNVHQNKREVNVVNLVNVTPVDNEKRGIKANMQVTFTMFTMFTRIARVFYDIKSLCIWDCRELA